MCPPCMHQCSLLALELAKLLDLEPYLWQVPSEALGRKWVAWFVFLASHRHCWPKGKPHRASDQASRIWLMWEDRDGGEEDQEDLWRLQEHSGQTPMAGLPADHIAIDRLHAPRPLLWGSTDPPLLGANCCPLYQVGICWKQRPGWLQSLGVFSPSHLSTILVTLARLQSLI